MIVWTLHSIFKSGRFVGKENIMLISESYRELNKDVHAGGRYGQNGDKWLDQVEDLIQRYLPASILDYGCGQGALGKALERPIFEYDPAIEGKDTLPKPADLVICTDVIEHIEPELIDEVLAHLHSLTKKAIFIVIATRAANKILADGRNAHLIVEPWPWWEKKIALRFSVVDKVIDPMQAVVILEPLGRLESLCRRGLATLRKR
ncbi:MULTISPECIES: class I SAM-dependent methyltransferase [unclassified Sphingobium]|uniref:class I SAM-dependent methyltransferase n=1 Tax=unclassified Sphingobium TaxID=2611147 RepID=UPI002223FC11|nr:MULTISPECIES: class I SAM-dependent methyltransferase [unclassified Sphingobium]MCW2411677.1 hypothetical protein [Sphingobium sp. B8D3D]MCW2416030.1 hypothetical protein [Sphingobium sp. B8D3A]